MKQLILDGIWKMNRCGEEMTYAAKIPGSVLSTLLDAGAISDPYDRMNEYEVRDLFWND